MQDYYHLRAREYDSSMGYDSEEKIRELEPMIRLVENELHGRKVLELACGPGFWTKIVSKSAKSVLATDYNQSTLDEAAAKQFPNDIVKLQQLDAYQLNSLGEQFDTIFATDWFAHIPRTRISHFLNTALKQLHPTDNLLFVDQLPGAYSLTQQFDHEGNHLQERKISDGSKFSVIKNFFSNEELIQIFEPFSGELEITRLPNCRRIVVKFATDKQT